MTMQCTILESSADIMKNDYGIIALPFSSFYFYVHFYIYQLFKYQSYKLLPLHDFSVVNSFIDILKFCRYA